MQYSTLYVHWYHSQDKHSPHYKVDTAHFWQENSSLEDRPLENQ